MEYICSSLFSKYKKYKFDITKESWFLKLSHEEQERKKRDSDYLWFVESTIAKILMENPHPNIVSIYKVDANYIEMEFLNTQIIPRDLDMRKLYEAKKHLQKLGIAYIDWKHDNVGIDLFGNVKLFDFNLSGMYSGNEWMITPIHGYIYREAIKNQYQTPEDIDNYAFIYGFYLDCMWF